MKQHWTKAALAVISVFLYSALPALAQPPGGYYGGGRAPAYSPSQQGYGQGQGYYNPGQYSSGYYGQGQGNYNQPGQMGYNQGGYYQGYQGQGWNQPGQWWGTSQYSGPWQGGWNQPGSWNNGYVGQNTGPYHYGRGYYDGYQHGYYTSNRGYTGPQGPQGPQGSQGPQGPQQGGHFQFARIRGELQQTKQVKMPGLEEPMLVGVLTSDQGERILAAFGPAKGVENLKLQPDQQITVTGELCRTCRRPIMLVEQVRAHGKTVPIQAFQDIEPQRDHVRGKLMKIHRVQFPGIREAMMIGVVKTKDGKDTIVNLGSADQTGELDLEDGTQVSIQGTGFEINGHQVLFADHIRANGQTLTLHE